MKSFFGTELSRNSQQRRAEILDHSHFLKDFNGSLMSCSFVSHTIAMAPRAKKRRNLPHLHHHKDLKEQMKIGSWNQKPHKETLLWFLLLWCPWKMLFCVNGIFPPLSEDDTFFKLLKLKYWIFSAKIQTFWVKTSQ